MLFEGTKAEQIKNDYDRDGYVRLPGFLNPDELKELLTNQKVMEAYLGG